MTVHGGLDLRPGGCIDYRWCFGDAVLLFLGRTALR